MPVPILKLRGDDGEMHAVPALRGEKGDKGDAFTYSDFTDDQLAALTGPQGVQGETGPAGQNGSDGPPGETGPQGEKGDTGDPGVYYGTEEPTDPSHPIWIDPNGEADTFSPPISDTTPTATNPYSGAKVEERLGTFVRPNLLDNWYFPNAVNQRGNTIATTVGYFIDRWKVRIANTFEISDSGLNITTAANTTASISEYLGNDSDTAAIDQLKGKQITVSALLGNGELIYATDNIPVSITQDANFAYASNGDIAVYVRCNASGAFLFDLYVKESENQKNVCVVAAKLELGDTQTLAHENSDGDWVLNEIPIYAEQLSACQFYLRKFSSGGGAAIGLASATTLIQCSCPLNPPMRTTPSCSIVNSVVFIGKSKYSINNGLTGTFSSLTGNNTGVRVSFSVQSAVADAPYMLLASSGLYLSSEY